MGDSHRKIEAAINALYRTASCSRFKVCDCLQALNVLISRLRRGTPLARALIPWNDSGLGIEWPVKDAIVSERDAKGVPLKDAETNFEYPI